ncbi:MULTISPECIES: hypothetical protein [unclassified Paenibacillus]|uniref:hypothetical protein n=1 Tax=unclassified Paenibacillus TaxID=185978 RepID=UPI001AE6FBAD|nr:MULTISPECIES: hypothetical protein [unclassified Paenibacillus]MBP1154177.1 hypothetical protein [Paenibacillus sp. PvP091]MBP1170438.1 hypothetical protein [Paenibacillus sp. PvR098]MBP2441466.1 hypothetical protein [Paenibacillus sp. PvP052]
MDRFLTYVGGLIGSYALIEVPVGGIDELSGLNTIFDFIGIIAMIVFAGALIYRGVCALIAKY